MNINVEMFYLITHFGDAIVKFSGSWFPPSSKFMVQIRISEVRIEQFDFSFARYVFIDFSFTV